MCFASRRDFFPRNTRKARKQVISFCGSRSPDRRTPDKALRYKELFIIGYSVDGTLLMVFGGLFWVEVVTK
jgi:hypothetical protein